MKEIIRTNPSHPSFIELVAALNQELAEVDGPDHAFYSKYNSLDDIKQVVMVYLQGMYVACGAIKCYEAGVMEVKRMYTRPAYRGQGFASTVLNELEYWAVELSAHRLILETGLRQPEAIALYKRNNYGVIANYGQYQGVANSVCFEKHLTLRHHD